MGFALCARGAKQPEAGTPARCGVKACGVLGSVQGKVSSFTSRHRQQHWSLALALFGVAAAHGLGGGGRKQNM